MPDGHPGPRRRAAARAVRASACAGVVRARTNIRIGAATACRANAYRPPREGGSVIPKPPIMQRHVEPFPGWTEPERRKYRFRLEDVAFD